MLRKVGSGISPRFYINLRDKTEIKSGVKAKKKWKLSSTTLMSKLAGEWRFLTGASILTRHLAALTLQVGFAAADDAVLFVVMTDVI